MLNKATLIGRVGKKENKPVKTGNMTTLCIATNRKYLDSKGQNCEQTTWHTVNFFSKLADIAFKYVHVGDLVYIEGEINHKQVDNPNGGSKWLYSINGSEIKFLPNMRKAKDDNNYGNAKPEINTIECPF